MIAFGRFGATTANVCLKPGAREGGQAACPANKFAFSFVVTFLIFCCSTVGLVAPNKSVAQTQAMQSIEKLTVLANGGDIAAQEQLAERYETGNDVLRDDRAAIAWWQKAASAGSARAQWMLGQEYTAGVHIGRNYQVAVDWYTRSADQGYEPAQINLIGMLQGGYPGVPADLTLAAQWALRAAEQGSANAAHTLGEMYAGGTGVQRNLSKSVFWWRKAAEAGNHWAQARLGSSYFLGQGVDRDFSQAAVWYQRAVEGGRFEVIEPLADLYRAGQGVPFDSAKAASLYQQAAMYGSDSARLKLGELHERGEGVPRNPLQAYAWYETLVEPRPRPTAQMQQLETLIEDELLAETKLQMHARSRAIID